MKVKFIDLASQVKQIKNEVLRNFDEIIENTSFISGRNIELFEEAFKKYLGVKYCVAVNNGTSALILTLLGNGIGRGDEVIVPVNTFIATAEAVSLVGAKPIFVDINENNYTIDVTRIEEKLTKNTKAIIPVHLYGQCANMDMINHIAKKNKLVVIEDACQAHGSEYKGKKAGSLSHCAAFSFYPGKNLGAWGEGGAVTTNNKKLADKLRLIRNHGSKYKYHHDILGANYRLDEFQGAVLLTKLKYLDRWNKKRKFCANAYLNLFNKTIGVISPFVEPYNIPNWHLFVIRVKKRDQLMKTLANKGIQAVIHYPTPLHLTKVYMFDGYKKGDFPVAEKVQKEILSLPLYPELKNHEIQYIVTQVKSFLLNSKVSEIY